jgi:hypothetical protein
MYEPNNPLKIFLAQNRKFKVRVILSSNYIWNIHKILQNFEIITVPPRENMVIFVPVDAQIHIIIIYFSPSLKSYSYSLDSDQDIKLTKEVRFEFNY